MEVRNSKSVVTGTINNRDGNVHVGDNYYQSSDYQSLSELQKVYRKMVRKADNDREAAEYEQKLLAVERQIEEFKADVLRLAEEFQAVELNTERLKTARDHFDHGRYKEARAVLDTQDMGKELNDLLGKQADLEQRVTVNHEQLKDKATEFYLSAMLTSLDFSDPDRYEKTVERYEQSLRADKNTLNVSAYANFLLRHNQFARSSALYEELLEIQRILAEDSDEYTLDLAISLNNISITQIQGNRQEAGESSLREAIEVYGKLHQELDGEELPYLALAYNNLAYLLDGQQRYKEAKDLYTRSLELHRTMLEEDRLENRPKAATTMTNLGTLHRKRREFGPAAKHLVKAVEIRRELFEDSVDDRVFELASSLIGLATLRMDEEEFKQAWEHYTEADRLLRELARKNGPMYYPALFTVLQNLGVLHARGGKFEDADAYYKSALKLARLLAEGDPDAYSDEVASCLSCLSDLRLNEGKLEDAKTHSDDALEIYTRLSDLNPGAYAAERENIRKGQEEIERRRKDLT